MDLTTTTQQTVPVNLHALEAHELTFEQFAAQVRVTPVEGFDRKWSVALPGRFVSFSDKDTAEAATQDAHCGAVHSALSAQLDPEFSSIISMPPAEVLAQYPDVVALFPDLGISLPQQA